MPRQIRDLHEGNLGGGGDGRGGKIRLTKDTCEVTGLEPRLQFRSWNLTDPLSPGSVTLSEGLKACPNPHRLALHRIARIR